MGNTGAKKRASHFNVLYFPFASSSSTRFDAYYVSRIRLDMTI